MKVLSWVSLWLSLCVMPSLGFAINSSSIQCARWLRSLQAWQMGRMGHKPDVVAKGLQAFRTDELGQLSPGISHRSIEADGVRASTRQRLLLADRIFGVEQHLKKGADGATVLAIQLEGEEIQNFFESDGQFFQTSLNQETADSFLRTAWPLALAPLSALSLVHAVTQPSHWLLYSLLAYGLSGPAVRIFRTLFSQVDAYDAKAKRYLLYYPSETGTWQYVGFERQLQARLIPHILTNKRTRGEWNKQFLLEQMPPGFGWLMRKSRSLSRALGNVYVLGDILYRPASLEDGASPAKLILTARIFNERPKSEPSRESLSVLEVWRTLRNLRPAPIKISR